MLCHCCTPEEDSQTVHAITVDEAETLPVKEQLPSTEPSVSQQEEAVDFTVCIERSNLSVPLGAMLDPSGYKGIHVSSISNGETALNSLNLAAPASHRVRAGDYIAEVNGISGDHFKMLNEMLTKSVLNIRIVRASEFNIVINRRGESLGCTITYDACSGSSLVVDGVLDGPVAEWNKGHQDRQVNMGDRILSANGQTGSSTDLLEMIKSTEGSLTLRFSRPMVNFGT